MGSINTIKPSIDGLIRNPILIGIACLYGLIQLPQFALEAVNPLLASLFSMVFFGVMIFVFPFFQGGLIGMANNALKGSTTVDTLIEEGKGNYLQLLLSYVLLFAVMFVLGMIAFFAVLIAAVMVFAIDSGIAALLIFGGIALLGLLVYLTTVFFIQFYGHAIVLDDKNALGGFKHSASLVRQNLLSTIGYSLILFIGGGFFGVIAGTVSLVLSQPPGLEGILPELHIGLLAVSAVLYILATGIATAFYLTYSVAFYQGISTS